jgi:CobQ-like glutamine amidotransferase family enzyme
MRRLIHIVHLYPKEMNIYGDTGNTLVLQKRLEWRGISTKISYVGIGEDFPDEVDMVIGGGGQDAGQNKIQADLQKKADALNKMVEKGVVMLMVCGMYQLFGRSFKTSDGNEIKGIGILPLETSAGPNRYIGNTLYKTPFGDFVGYENHSGITMLDSPEFAFGSVLQGAGNNGQDSTEGCIKYNVYGTYSHGPVLSKNPRFADLLLDIAISLKYPGEKLEPLDDSLEAIKRPR